MPRIGAQWSVYETQRFQMKLRGGYFFEPSPTPSQDKATNYVDGHKHGLSWGIGFGLQDRGGILPHPIEIGLSMQAILVTETTHTKVNPADPIGEYTPWTRSRWIRIAWFVF